MPNYRLIFSLAALLACASGGKHAESAQSVTPPSMVSTARPELRLPRAGQNGLAADIQIQVGVDATGRPDMSTLRVTGLGAAENQAVIEAWIVEARFRPAQQSGQPVPGVYRTRLQIRSQVRRVGA